MFEKRFLPVFVVLFTGLTLTFSVAPAAADDFIEGQIVSIYSGQLTLNAGGEILEFFVPNDARITLDGIPAQLSDLSADHIATVTAKKSGEQYIANAVHAMSQR